MKTKEENQNRKNNLKTMIDPPSGWRYGFPKELPQNVGNMRTWLIENGYPEQEVDFALRYCRMWVEE